VQHSPVFDGTRCTYTCSDGQTELNSMASYIYSRILGK